MNLKIKKIAIPFCIILITILLPFLNGKSDSIILPFACLLLGFLLMLILYLNPPLNTNAKHIFKKLPTLAIIIFLLVLLASNFFSVTPYFSWFCFLETMVFVSIFIVLSSLTFSQKFLETFSLIFLGTATTLSLIGIYIYEMGHSTLITSILYNPNVFASYLLFSLPLALYFLFNSSERKRSLLFAILAILLFSTFILTKSRGGLISAIPSLPLLVLLFHRQQGIKKIAKIILILLIGCFLLTTTLSSLRAKEIESPIISKSTYTYLAQVETSLSDRSKFWQGTISMFREKPFLGWGLSSFETIYPRYQSSAVEYAKYPHNYYLGLLGETGIAGAIFFYTFIISLIYLGFKSIQKTLNKDFGDKKIILSSVFFLSILSSIIHSSLDFNWNFQVNLLTFFILAGIFLGSINQPTIESESKKRTLTTKYFILLIGSIFIFTSLVLSYSFYCFRKGEKLEDIKDYSSAISTHKKGTTFNPNPKYLLRQGILLYSTGKLNQAQELTNELKQISPQDKEAFLLAGKIKAKKKDHDAENDFKKAILINPYFINAYLELSQFYLQEGEINESLKILEQGIKKYDEDSIQYFKEQRSNIAKALRVKEEDCYLTPVDKIASFYFLKGEIENKTGKQKEAECSLERAKEIMSPIKK